MLDIIKKTLMALPEKVFEKQFSIKNNNHMYMRQIFQIYVQK